MDGIKLTFDEDALDYIVDKAIEYKLGARGLRSICEAIMMDGMFDLPGQEGRKSLRVTVPYAKSRPRKRQIPAIEGRWLTRLII